MFIYAKWLTKPCFNVVHINAWEQNSYQLAIFPLGACEFTDAFD